MKTSEAKTKPLSIPERARELIKERLHVDGDLPELRKLVEAALHSERELCAKELEDAPDNLVIGGGAAKLLRERGQK